MKIYFLLSAFVIFLLSGFRAIKQPAPWSVPDKFAKMTNPVKSDAASIATGKQIWSKHCQSCHGKAGKGDGPKAAQLKTLLEDLTKPAVQNQSDGSLFYKTSEGRKDMPSFKKKIADPDDIWAVVNYMRSLKK